MISQCATERVDKIPKEVWTDDRLRLSPQAMIRDVFVHSTNMNYFPFPMCNCNKLCSPAKADTEVWIKLISYG